ncbi:MAG: hypothetical protein R2932_14900 [Caldilineaceae bacterium]
MQYMLHNGPYRGTDRARSQAHILSVAGRQLLGGYVIALKIILIACVVFAFFQLVAYLLSLSDSVLVQLPALAAWSCGAIPLIYRLWRFDLGVRAQSS